MHSPVKEGKEEKKRSNKHQKKKDLGKLATRPCRTKRTGKKDVGKKKPSSGRFSLPRQSKLPVGSIAGLKHRGKKNGRQCQDNGRGPRESRGGGKKELEQKSCRLRQPGSTKGGGGRTTKNRSVGRGERSKQGSIVRGEQKGGRLRRHKAKATRGIQKAKEHYAHSFSCNLGVVRVTTPKNQREELEATRGKEGPRA